VWQAIANCTGMIATAVVGLVMVPVMFHHLGGASYGLWIAMESVAALLARVDLGLSWALTREIAAETESGYTDQTRSFVYASGTVALLIGLTGAACMAALGGPLGAALGVSRSTASLLFAIGGAVFLFESLKVVALAVLRGTGRFDVLNAVIAAATVLWGAGAIVLLEDGAGVISLVLWQMVSAALSSGCVLFAARACAPDLRLRLDWPRAKVLSKHASFSLASQLVILSGAAVWETPPFIVGILLGAPQIVPYYIGRTFPSAASGVAWRTAEVVFPAASARDQAGAEHSTAAVLESGTRLNLVAMIPIYILLWVCAPELLALWVPSASTQSVLILRVLLIAQIFDAASLGSSTVLWATGAFRTLLAVDLGMLAAGAGLCVPLVLWLGATGAAIALALTVAAGSCAYLIVAARHQGHGVIDLIRSTCNGLGLPSIACLGAAVFIRWLVPTESIAALVAVSSAGGIAYLVVLRVRGARPEERVVLSSLDIIAGRFARFFVGRVPNDG
jgi:O-antigen/teichoic acid export membrane protein